MTKPSLEDLTGQAVWSDIAHAYEQVIIRTSFYKEFMNDIYEEISSNVSQIRRQNPNQEIRVLDAGCGIGYLINVLLSQDPCLKVTGIDTNQYMLDIAHQEIISPGYNYTLIQADAETFTPDEPFDLIVSTNLLFNLPKPFNFITNCYDNLKDGGYFVLSSAHNNPNLPLLVEKAREEFREQGIEKEKAPYMEIVQKLNHQMMNSRFKTFPTDKIAAYLNDFYNFSIRNKTTTFHDQNFLVNAQKNKEGKIIIKIESGEESFQEAWSLKNFLLSEIMNLIPSDKQHQLASRYDRHSELLTARDWKTNKLLGFQNIIKDSEIGFPCEETVDITPIRRNYDSVVSFAGTYIVPRMMGKRLGAFLMAYACELMAEMGIKAGIAELNPELFPFAQRLGFKKYSSINKTMDGLEKVDVFAELQQNNIERRLIKEKAGQALGPENILLQI